MKKKKNIIFEVGDVLIHYRWKEMLMDYGLTEKEATRVGTQLFEDPEELWKMFDKGLLNENELVELYCKKYPKDAEVIRWFILHGEYMHVGRPAVWKKVRELKQEGYKIYLLSNYSEYLFERHTQYADFLEDIDGKLVSYMVKMAKPEREIYEALVDKFQLKPEECLFFDDRKENVEAAEACGIQSVQVLSQEQLLKELDALIE